MVPDDRAVDLSRERLEPSPDFQEVTSSGLPARLHKARGTCNSISGERFHSKSLQMVSLMCVDANGFVF